MRHPRFHKAVLFGTGLIGASLGRDLLRLGIARSVVGIDPSRRNLAAAKKIKAITAAGTSVSGDLRDADLVVLAAPVSAIGKLIGRIAPFVLDEALVIDVGSTKAGVADLARTSFPHGNFVGCHPMAGTEHSGAMASLKGLFAGKTCFIVAGEAKIRFVKSATALWRAVGAMPVSITALEHDRFAAHVSHIPHLAAFALMNAVAATGIGRVQKFSGGGLRDTTRIAASSPAMWRDIFLANARAVSEALAGFKNEVSLFENALTNRDGAALTRLMTKASKARRSL